MAPNFTKQDRLEYLLKEMSFIEELLDDAADCKWVYQSLIGCQRLVAVNQGSMTEAMREQLRNWLGELKKLDPLRAGRWMDLEQDLGKTAAIEP